MKIYLVYVVVLFVVLAGAGGDVAAAPDTDGKDGSLTVHYINAEYGVSTLAVGPTGETMLVDTAGHGGEKQVLEYLGDADIDRIDHLVATHAHGGHVGGHDDVIEFFESERDGVGTVYDSGIDRSMYFYEEYLDAVDEHEIDRVQLRRGDSIPFDGATVSVLSPPPEPLADRDISENSLVLRVEYGETSVRLTGDAGADAEKFLVDEEPEGIEASGLQAGKEGSDDGSTAEFLDAVAPAAVVVNGGAHDDDRPSPAVLDRLADRDVPTYWTASHGTTMMESDGRQITVAVQRNATTDPSSLRDTEHVSPGANATVESVGVLFGDGEIEGGETETSTPLSTPTEPPASPAAPSGFAAKVGIRGASNLPKWVWFSVGVVVAAGTLSLLARR